jgi:hypothetical protein
MLSMTEMSSMWSVAVFRLRLKLRALSGIGTVQNSPDGAMSALKSCSCSPELGS